MLSAAEVLAGAGVHLDPLAAVDEQRHLHDEAGDGLGRLDRRAANGVGGSRDQCSHGLYQRLHSRIDVGGGNLIVCLRKRCSCLHVVIPGTLRIRGPIEIAK